MSPTLEEILSAKLTDAPAREEKPPTAEQAAIIEEVKTGKKSIRVISLAGTGKTSTIERSAVHIKVPTLALAFNKKIKEELEKRLPRHFTVKTFNGLGHVAFGNAIRKRLILEEGKLFSILKDILKREDSDMGEDDFGDILALVRKARHAGLVPKKYPFKSIIPDEADTWIALAEEDLIEPKKHILDFAYDVLLECIVQSYKGVIDFDDQVYMSACFAGIFPRFMCTIVDEAQDLSPLNHIQIRKVSQGSRIIAVGDPRQAIYAFRGADSSSMDNLLSLSHEWVDLKLTTTFRCSKMVVSRQKGFVPEFNAWEGNEEGEIVDLRMKKWETQDILRYSGKTAVICRNNAPVIALALKLLARDIGVVVLGKDIGKTLINLVGKICGKDENLPSDVCALKITAWATKEIDKAQAKGQQSKVAGIADRQDALLAVIDNSEAKTLREIKAKLQYLFSGQAGLITLSTGHKAKGLEWENVVHLNSNLIPSKYARQAMEEGNPIPHEQDMNLRYVIETRAKVRLILAHLDDFEKEAQS